MQLPLAARQGRQQDGGVCSDHSHPPFLTGIGCDHLLPICFVPSPLPGDLLGSGTISGPDPSSRGCLLELAWGGAQPLDLTACPIQTDPEASSVLAAGMMGGSPSTAAGNTPVQRVYLEDGDTVVMRGWCEQGGVRIGFGECRGALLPAHKK
jgi:hypothetical protein